MAIDATTVSASASTPRLLAVLRRRCSPNRVSKGTKVRVINDPRGPNDLGEVEVYVLEGVNKDEKVSVSRRNVVTF